ncbi:hypothetical protein H0B56_12470 [Haloechinothrix sp. YIM 98757]|uniref:Uncharacterized protein n=1 Tax=Haloechinothrix aidingensis TaxID=2752311 RepID=A0A838AAW2_9PSEU|nr:hypothetical protein [Haloechinothrix aidingensis]MBA0126358.1 hypothetical protein [Haloechinothrix aidingensis]
MRDRDVGGHPDPGGRNQSAWRGFRARRHARRTARQAGEQWQPGRGSARARTVAMLVAALTVPLLVAGLATHWDTVLALAGTDVEDEPVPREPPERTAQTRVPEPAVDLHQPFAGTPAAGWDDGIGGIDVAEPEAVGSFTAGEVAEATEQVLDTIEAAYLNRRVIAEHDAGPYLATLAPDVRDEIEAELADPNHASGYVTRIAESFELLPAQHKVNGSLAVEPGGPGELAFEASFSVAYAFDTDEPDRLLDPLDIVSLRRIEEQFSVVSGDGFARSSHGVWPEEQESVYYSMSCEALEDGYLAPAFSERRRDAQGAEHDDEYYFDPDEPLTDEDGC